MRKAGKKFKMTILLNEFEEIDDIKNDEVMETNDL